MSQLQMAKAQMKTPVTRPVSPNDRAAIAQPSGDSGLKVAHSKWIRWD
jgi:hypothetical protein